MKIGSYAVSALETGIYALDGGAMFGVVPKLMWQEKTTSDDRNRIPLALRTMLIQGEGRNILVDAGIGAKWSRKMLDLYGIEQPVQPLEDALAACNLTPADITDLIVTHLHFDHAGGATKYDLDRNVVPTLPNARVHIQKSNWDHAQHPNEKDRASYLPDNFIPLMEAGLVEMWEGECEILPGVTVIPSNGHTIGQQLVLVGRGYDAVLYCGDLIPTRAHLPIPWVMGYDLYPLTTIEEKKTLLRRASEEQWTLFFEHDPKITSCKIDWTDTGAQVTATNLF